MRDRWVPHFLGFLKRLESLGKMGASRATAIYADGDGDFQPKFTWDTDIAPAQAYSEDADGGQLFDAG